MGTLTAATAKSLSKPDLHGDGATLYLNVAAGGSKSWIQRVTIDGRRRDLGLGPYPAVSLAQARRRAAHNRAAIADGRDPLAEKRRAALPTFRQAAELTFEATRPRWRNAKHTKNWMQGLAKYALPVIGGLRVDRILREDVLRILTPIWATRPETARKLRGRIRSTLRWCQAHGFVDRNVAGEGIDGALPAMPRVASHFRALPYRDVPDALNTVEASSASLAGKLCLRFLILTARADEYYRELEQRRLNPVHHVRKIVALSEIYGTESTARALDDAFDYGAFSSDYITNLLEARARSLPEPSALHLTPRADLLELEPPQPDLSLYDPPGGPRDDTP